MPRLLICLFITLTLGGASFAQPVSEELETPPPSTEEVITQKIFELVNQERARNGLPAFVVEPRLNVAALTHSQEMLDKNYQSHYSPTPGRRTVKERMRQAGITPSIQAENIFHCENFPVEELAQLSFDQWMKSRGHRANILRREVSHTGIGVVYDEGKFYATQVFAGGL